MDLLFQALADDEFPMDMECLQTFLFDRCMDWPHLLGLWQGMQMIQHWGEEIDDEDRYQQQVAADKQQLRQVLAEGSMIEHIEATYTAFNRDYNYQGSGHWHWFQENEAQLMRRAYAARTPPKVGHRVRLKGLAARPELNGAAGTVAGADKSSGRLSVKLDSPPSAVALHPPGVRVQPANLEVLPAGAALAVLISGPHMGPAFAFGTPVADGWERCPVPALLGLPLAYRRMGVKRQHSNESAATLLTIDPDTGFAPMEVQACGVGPVLVARTDGEDFTVEEMEDLHAYNVHLMEIWPEENGMNLDDAWKERHYSPAAFRNFTRKRQQQVG